MATARLKGIISAGTLHDAVEADLGTIPLDRLFSDLDEIFVIRVLGQPMRGADIHDGDYVLLIDEVISEEGIGAMLYNGETSLKRVCHDEDGLRLEPCNPEYDDIHIQPDVLEEVTILGRYGGHVNEDGIYKKGHGGGVGSRDSRAPKDGPQGNVYAPFCIYTTSEPGL